MFLKRCLRPIALFVLATTPVPLHAQEAYIRVVDVGNGLCVVGRVPGGGGFVYDGGYRSDQCVNAVREILPDGRIDVLILSHSDADHIGEIPQILANGSSVGTIFHPGDNRTGTAISQARSAISHAATSGTTEINLANAPDPLGRVIPVGDGSLTFVAGWSDGLMTRGPHDRTPPGPERRNALSIVMRFQYGGHSLLLTGDTIGRLGGEPNSVCRYAERIMVERSAEIAIKSDVLVGQHHGGDNATSNCFIRAVNPRYVIFSAGHGGHEHPRQTTADRLIAHGINPADILRTDRGDNEGGPEWIYGAIRGCRDKVGDDDVEIVMPKAPEEELRVKYRVASTGC